MIAKDATIYGWSETNKKWSPRMIKQANTTKRRIHKNYKMIATSSDEESTYKQMGGICTDMVDNIVGSHIESRGDKCSLGRWMYAYITGKDQRKAYIMTGYRPCMQSNPGSEKATAQQKWLLRMKGNRK
eukprot:2716812-Ditylum_brightwellii.AAC.1